MRYREVEARTKARHLCILGGFHPTADDMTPEGTQTLLLIGPDEPRFWPVFQQSPEWLDGKADPMDRWSKRVIDGLADQVSATALFPFGGPPYLPFYSWALGTGRIHASPVRLLVHDKAGLLVSFRGALAFRERIALLPAPPSPCERCSEKPCLGACPVGALDGAQYDVPACKSWLERPEGTDCMSRGCAVRRSCPVSKNHPRLEAQSAYHMAMFKG